MQINANPHLVNPNPQVQNYPQRLYRTVVNGTLLKNIKENGKIYACASFAASTSFMGTLIGCGLHENGSRALGYRPSIPLSVSECPTFRDSNFYTSFFRCEESFLGFSNLFQISVSAIPVGIGLGFVIGSIVGIGETILTA